MVNPMLHIFKSIFPAVAMASFLAHAAPQSIGIIRACRQKHSHSPRPPALARFFRKRPTNIQAYPVSPWLNMGRTLSLPGLLWPT